MSLHADFPEAPQVGAHYWELPNPLPDIVSALSTASGDLSLDDLASVELYDITSNEGKWEPGGEVGTELQMTLLGTLVDGRWFSIEAWNDYTGWGCQDQSDLYIGATRQDVITNGLTTDGRNALGVTA